VPGILRANACPNMMLEARVVRRWLFWRRVEVLAFCLKTLGRVEDPYAGCGECHLQRPGAQGLWAVAAELSSENSRATSSGSKRGNP
jgi:hypothetical protein